VEDLDGEVLALLTEDLLGLLLEDLAGPMVGIDDVVADLEIDVLDLDDLEVLNRVFDYLGNWSPPCCRSRSVGIGPRG
jgi:hypothetical protein